MAKIENTNIPTWFWVGTRSQYAHEGMKNRGPILVFDCGDGRTEVEGTTEVGFETMETSHSL